MGKAKNARHMRLYVPEYGTPEKDSGNTTPNTWYRVDSLASGSELSKDPETGDGLVNGLIVGDIFKSNTNNNDQFTLKKDDVITPIAIGSKNLLALTECTVSVSQESIDVTDNEGTGGFRKHLPTGFSDLTGTITRFTKFGDDDVIEGSSERMMQRFFNIIEDRNTNKEYRVRRANNDELLAFVCLNSNAVEGKYQNWLIFNLVVTSYDLGGAIMDALKGDMNYMKGSGEISLYKRKVGAGDQL